MSADPRYKQCPDCAEQVLAAARKCRYCGYRFDGGAGERQSLLGGLIPGFSQQKRTTSLPELLADWGMEFAEGERVVRFTFATVDRRNGYLLLTSERLVFFEHYARGKQRRTFQYPLEMLVRAQLHGGLGKRRIELTLSGDGRTHTIDAGTGSQTRALHAGLIEHLNPAPHDPPGLL